MTSEQIVARLEKLIEETGNQEELDDDAAFFPFFFQAILLANALGELQGLYNFLSLYVKAKNFEVAQRMNDVARDMGVPMEGE